MQRIDKKFIMKWSGLGLIIVALLFIPVMAAIPFMSFSIKQKTIFISILAVGGQVLTWAGIFLAGKEIVSRYRKYLDPRYWFKKNGVRK